MNKFWKWFLIIAGGLFILGLVVLVPVLIGFNQHMFPMMRFGARVPMMHGFGFMGAGMMFFRLLIPLGLIGLLILLGVAIGKSGKPAQVLAAPSVASAPVETKPEEKTCTACGQQLEPDWANCPYCGQKI